MVEFFKYRPPRLLKNLGFLKLMPEIQKEGAHYITLKEAAKISGYTPDYLGQLIRKGKLKGKQIYLNVAWVTTETSLKDYMENNKVDSKKKMDFMVAIRSKFKRWAVAHSSGDDIMRMARRVIYIVIGLLVVFCLFLIYAFFANMFHGTRLP